MIVGGGPAGHAAAEAYRDEGGADRVRIVSADSAAPYHRPPLSKDFLRGESGEDELPLGSHQSYADQEFEMILDARVLALDPGERRLTTPLGTLAYDQCILATGSTPKRLPVPGADSPAVHVLRSLDQARALRAAAREADRAIVIGSGFIGCEAAASMAALGVAVTLLTDEPMPQLTRLGDAAAQRISAWLDDAGVTLLGSVQVKEVVDGRSVRLGDGRTVAGDLVLTAVGVEPCSELADAAGLALRDGRIVVDQHMRTSAAHVFAAGDVVSAHNGAAGRPLAVEHWGEAIAMGQVAGRVAAAGAAEWSEVPGFWSEIGEHTLKYAAWGDGFDEARLVEYAGGAFTVWYSRDDIAVGVLTHDADADYEQGAALIAAGRPLP